MFDINVDLSKSQWVTVILQKFYDFGFCLFGLYRSVLFMRKTLRERRDFFFLCCWFICHCLIAWLICLLVCFNSLCGFGSGCCYEKREWKKIEVCSFFFFLWIYLYVASCNNGLWIQCLLRFLRCMCRPILWSSTGFLYWGMSKLPVPFSVSGKFFIFMQYFDLRWTSIHLISIHFIQHW